MCRSLVIQTESIVIPRKGRIRKMLRGHEELKCIVSGRQRTCMCVGMRSKGVGKQTELKDGE